MTEKEVEPPSEQVKALFDADKALPEKIVDERRSSTLHRARASIGFRDTIAFAFIKIWAFFRE